MENCWSIKPILWNKWGIFINDRLVVKSEERYLCRRFLRLSEDQRWAKINNNPTKDLQPLDLEIKIN